jgi:hypothetical protein
MSHSSNSANDFEIDLSDNGSYIAPGMQLALMQQIALVTSRVTKPQKKCLNGTEI